MKKITACILFAAAALSASAQRSHIKSQQDPVFAEWETTPKPHPIPPEYAGLNAYNILNSVTLDYKYEGKNITTYYTQHKIIKVLDEKGISMFNTISIPVYHNSKILSIKARTILANGKVHDIPREMIRQTINEAGVYEVGIALEGVEQFAEIELLLKEINTASYFGSLAMQSTIPSQHTFFEMNYPKEMYFEQKGYNGFPQLKDTLIAAKKRRTMGVYIADMPALKQEPYTFYDLHRMRTEYRLSYIMDEGNEKIRMNTWDDLIKHTHSEVYTLTEKEKAAANKYISTLGITNKGNNMENIRKIEEGIKNNIVLYDYVADKTDNLDSIIQKKAATTNGYLKLFAACFTMAKVEHQLGLTTDKHEHTFDSKFENWNNMENYVFYFPAVNKYLAPTSVYYRCPMVPHEMVGNKALFCAIPPDGKLTGQICEVKTIQALNASESQYSINAKVNFSKEMEPEVDITYSYTGYEAAGLRTRMMLMAESKKNEAVERMIPLADKTEDIVKYNIVNTGFDNYYNNKPLVISAIVKTPQLVEKADKKYLVKLGDIIGKQTQLYKEEERHMPVDLEYPHANNRTITMTIPKGYKILNPQIMRKRADYVDGNGKPVVAFTSDYKIAGNTLTVTINEFYQQTHFAVGEYERYRTVINTAADFNKVTLVLGKI